MSTVVITGCSSGIGLASAEKFHSKGWKVIGIDKQKPKDGGLFAKVYIADISDEGKIADICMDIQKESSKLDSLILSAATQIVKPFEELSTDEWNYTYDVNVKSAWNIIKCLMPALQSSDEEWASIVAVSSIHGVVTSSGLSSYASSKAALIGLVRSLAIELAPHKVRANAVVPGAVNTPMLSDHLTETQIRKLASRQLLGRVARPEEIANSIEFLATTDSSYITGQYLIVDGGVQMLLATEVD